MHEGSVKWRFSLTVVSCSLDCTQLNCSIGNEPIEKEKKGGPPWSTTWKKRKLVSNSHSTLHEKGTWGLGVAQNSLENKTIYQVIVWFLKLRCSSWEHESSIEIKVGMKKEEQIFITWYFLISLEENVSFMATSNVNDFPKCREQQQQKKDVWHAMFCVRFWQHFHAQIECWWKF